jgi:hypothetical protein
LTITSIDDWAFTTNPTLTGKVIIPSTVTHIGDNAFSATKVVSVSLPKTIQSLNGGIFTSCPLLQTIEMPVTVDSISSGFLYACPAITSFTIPATVSYIGNENFDYCTALQSIYASPVKPVDLSFNSDNFKNVNKSTCILYVPKGTLAAYQSALGWKDFLHIVEFTPSSHGQSSIVLFEGDTTNARNAFAFADSISVNYEIKNAAIATIESNGTLHALQAGTTELYAENRSNTTQKDSTIIQIVPVMKIQALTLSVNDIQIKVTVNCDFPLYNGMANDFYITADNDTAHRYLVTTVMKDKNNPNVLLLQLDRPIVINVTINISYAPVNAETEKPLLKSSFSIQTTTKVPVTEMIDAKLYPNPALSILTFEANDLKEIKIISMQGQVLVTASAQDNNVSLSIEALPAGIYIAEFLTTSQNVRKSFVKR